jgi:membrane-associated HD superfamily phosphohydrolase
MKTWTSVLLVLVICWALFFNISLIVESADLIENKSRSKIGGLGIVAGSELIVGLIGTGTVLLFFIIACLAIFLNKHERPNMDKSQKACYISMGVLLGISLLTHLQILITRNLKSGDLTSTFTLTIVVSALRLLIAGAVVGCGVHAIKNN